MLSNPDVYPRLAGGFVGLRLDWEQGNRYRERFGFILGTGDQLLLDPEGKPIGHGRPGKEDRRGIIYGRHGCDTTAEVLDAAAARHPQHPGPLHLKLEWFLWPSIPCRGGAGRYPVPFASIAGFARLPIAMVDGPIPPALEDPQFLAWHVRQFIWARGEPGGESRLRILRVKDGLKADLDTDLATLRPAELSRERLGQALDRAWLEYMKHRPYTARGYLENPHGRWMRGREDQMVREEESIRRLARKGTLLPPGRTPGEEPPYRKKSF